MKIFSSPGLSVACWSEQPGIVTVTLAGVAPGLRTWTLSEPLRNPASETRSNQVKWSEVAVGLVGVPATSLRIL